MNIQLPAPVKYAMDALNRAGYQAYIVGGCVRDILLNHEPHDYDVTTSATPEQMLELFKQERLVLDGLKHGTVTLIKYGDEVEMTTFRIDGEYTDGRHPDAVAFTGNLYEDVTRRDFTMNALCWNPEIGLVDYVSGEADIQKRLVRCVGNADKRFQEDALRILRALRFSAVLDFDIEPMTVRSALDNRELLKKVSVERVLVELRKMLVGVRAERILLDFRAVLEVVMPELAGLTEEEYRLAARRVVRTAPQAELRLAALLYGIAPKQIGECAARLKFSRLDRKFVETMGRYAGVDLPKNRYEMRKRLNELGAEYVEAWMALKNADAAALYERVIQQADCVTLKQLAVNGEDVFAMGVPRKKTGVCLNGLLDAVMAERVPNEREALMELARVEFAEK